LLTTLNRVEPTGMTPQPVSLPQKLALAFSRAGDKSDVDFNFLLRMAMRESGLDSGARAAGSSATGLFQFLDSTWLEEMKTDGPRLGYGAYADAISQAPDGSYTVADPQKRQQILALRQDPQVSADLAAAYTRRNGDYLKEKFGRMPSPGELYIAHFLGARGAEKLFNAGLDNPNTVAADLFPHAALANRPIFYGADGHARTVRQVYLALVADQRAGGTQAAFSAQQIASGATVGVSAPDEPPQSVARPQDILDQGAAVTPLALPKSGVSFISLFSTGANGAGGSPVSSGGAGRNAAFFTKFYSK
jgi:hypothetical protein